MAVVTAGCRSRRGHGADERWSVTGKITASGGTDGECPGERTGASIRWRSIDAAHVVLARRTWLDWNEIRLRRLTLRRLHRPYQRRGHPLLRHHHVGRRGQVRDHDRGPRSEG